MMEKSFSNLGLHDQGETSNQSEDKIACPCHHYNSMAKVEEVLQSSDQVKAMIQWLDGETDAEALKVEKILSCGKRSRCRYRYGTSFAILNCIREVCRKFLEPQHGEAKEQQNSDHSVSGPGFTTSSFETAFPPLGSTDTDKKNTQFKPHPAASNILIPRKKSQSTMNQQQSSTVPKTSTNTVNTLVGKKKKKRIRPQLTQVTTMSQDSVWGQQPSNLGNKDRNISKHTAKKTQMVSLESRMSGATEREVPTKVSNTWAESQTSVMDLTEKSRSVAESKVSTKQNVDQLSNSEQSKKPTSESPESHVSRLVEIYIALIRNMLIPSTAMELHLLIRLLAVDGEKCGPVISDTLDPDGVFFKSIFSSPRRCNTFATRALSELGDIVENLSLPLLQSLIQCVPLRSKCSSLADRLSTIIHERVGRGLGAAEDIVGTHAILSLPFEASRDSRHNYKTQAEMSIYKNREETRDLFLHQLRVYMSEKGKGFQSQNMENAKENLRRESRKIIGNISSVNMPWFAEFLCELVLQVGLSPVQETDEEVLNIADKDKLQKLHKRFSSRASHTNKSSKKLVLAKRKESTAGSPWMEAQASFPGYQEFFFIFLLSADSFNLGMHFRNQLVATILRLSADHEVSHLEKRILDLQILARFLGFLIFSPNWHDGGLELTKMYPDDKTMRVSGGMQQLECLGLSCRAIIEESWLEGHSLLTVPWTTELLRMAKWDSLSLSSREFRQVVANLRALQSRLCVGDNERTRRFGPSMQLVSFSLESFFQSITGLPKLTSLPVDNLPEADELAEECLDVIALGLSMGSTIASSQHMEDLSNLMDSLNSSSIGRSPTKARKLRPSIVSYGQNAATDQVMDESPLKLAYGNEWQPSGRASWHELGGRGKGDTLRRLQDAFFHQNHGLKEICEFAVGQVIKKTVNQQILHSYCKDAFDQHSIHIFSSETDIEHARSHAMELSNACLRQSLQHSVKITLKALGPSNLQDKVLDVATSLAVKSGMQTGQPLLHAVVSNEADGYMNALKREEKKQFPRKVLTFDEDEPSLDDVIFSLGALYDYLDNNEATKWDVREILQKIQSAMDGLVKLEASMGSAIPEESSLRKLYEVFFNLDAMSVDFVNWCMTLDAVDKSVAMPMYFQVALHFSKHTSFGLRKLSACMDENILESLVVSWPEGPDATTELASLLSDMEDTDIIPLEMLRTVLKKEASSRAIDVLSIIERDH